MVPVVGVGVRRRDHAGGGVAVAEVRRYVSRSPFGSVEVEPLKVTVLSSTVEVNAALGGRFTALRPLASKFSRTWARVSADR